MSVRRAAFSCESPNGYHATMAELDNFRRGTRAEYLARFALSKVGFMAPVPREEDRFGTDLFLHLCKIENRDGRVVHVPVGPTLAFQVKSNRDDILLEGDNLRSFFDYRMPFFVAYVDVPNDRLEIYSACRRFAHSWYRDFATTLSLKFVTPDPEERNEPSSKNHLLYLYGPIASRKISEFEGDEGNTVVANLLDVLQSWSLLDVVNQAFHSMGVPIFAHPIEFGPNEPLPRDTLGHLKSLNGSAAWPATVSCLNFITDVLAAHMAQADMNVGLQPVIDACKNCNSAASFWLETAKSAFKAGSSAS